MILLSSADLRHLADYLDTLTEATRTSGVAVCAYTSAGVSMPGWPHALEIDRSGEGEEAVYALQVGSAQ